ncbi:MAG: hypothetical protein WB680_19550 [Candidatus Acidiferrales bacterium]
MDAAARAHLRSRTVGNSWRVEPWDTLTLLRPGAQIASSQENPGASSTVQVKTVIADDAVRDNTEIPILHPENVQIKQGKHRLKVSQVIPARRDNAALQLFILTDDTCDTGIGNQSIRPL